MPPRTVSAAAKARKLKPGSHFVFEKKRYRVSTSHRAVLASTCDRERDRKRSKKRVSYSTTDYVATDSSCKTWCKFGPRGTKSLSSKAAYEKWGAMLGRSLYARRLACQKEGLHCPDTIPVCVKSKSGKPCTSACYNVKGQKEPRCKTKPYTKFFRTYDWDYCDPKDALKNVLLDETAPAPNCKTV